jgi:histidinol-phosphate phosphatase family protein
VTQAVILAGGKGTRLASRLAGRPKPLVEVDGVPLLRRQIDALAQYGIDNVVLLVNHAADQIAAFIARENLPTSVTLIDDGVPKGTAGATLACLDRLEDRFVVVYGDTLFDLDVAHMIAEHHVAGADATLLLHPNDHPADSDLVEMDSEGWITAFHPCPHTPGLNFRNLVNAAFYIVEKRALAPWMGRFDVADFAKDLFPAMLTEGARLKGHVSLEYIKDIGTPARLDAAEMHLRSGLVSRARRDHPQRAVFIDRDGTLNNLNGHISQVQDLELVADASAAVKRLNEAEFRVVVVTNQPVVARGECDERGIAAIHAKLETSLGLDGAYLDATYYCPHHPDGGFPGEIRELKRDCACRKPGTGMVDEAARALNIDLVQSWVIGDSTADIAMAERAGLRSVLVATGEAGRDGKWHAEPTLRAANLLEAVRQILAAQPLARPSAKI